MKITCRDLCNRQSRQWHLNGLQAAGSHSLPSIYLSSLCLSVLVSCAAHTFNHSFPISFSFILLYFFCHAKISKLRSACCERLSEEIKGEYLPKSFQWHSFYHVPPVIRKICNIHICRRIDVQFYGMSSVRAQCERIEFIYLFCFYR